MNKRKIIKELEKEILDMAKDFKRNFYREAALKELDNVREKFTLDEVKNITWIVSRYPDFDHIELKVESKGQWVFRMCIAPQVILDNPKIAKSFAGMAYGFIKRGAVKE